MRHPKEGQKVPNVTFHTRQNGEWRDLSTEEIFKGKRVIVFALPGAFTPTCSSTHLPRYEELAPVFRQKGIDDIYCLSVNDAFVMEAWGKELNVKEIKLLPDGNADFTKGMGTLVDKAVVGFGARSWRYSMLVEDGVIQKMFVEEDTGGDPFKVSDADTMLDHVAPGTKRPDEVTIFSKPGCQFCINAKKLLTEHGLHYEEILLGTGISYKTIRNVTGQKTAPQIYINGQHIKGYDALKEYFAKKS